MKSHKFLIVGQGLAGTMLAFKLLEARVDFKIASTPTKSKASLVAAGMVNPLVFKRMTKSWMVDELLPQMQNTYRKLEEKLGEVFYFEKEILKPLSEQEKELWQQRKQQNNFSSYVGEIETQAPIDFLTESAAYATVKGAGYLNLAHFLQCAELFFRERNLLIEKEFEIGENPAIASEVQFNNLHFEKVVFCQGAHLSHQSIWDFVKLNPVKGEVLQIYAPNLSEEFILNKQVFVLPVGNHRFKVGSTYEWKDLNESTTEAGKLSIIERLNRLISVDYKIENQWAGIRPTVIDRRPVLGQHPQHKNCFVFNGLGTKGVMLGPYFAQVMVQFLTLETYSLSHEINVQRFV